MAMTYSSLVSDLSNWLVVPATNTAYLQAIPNIITDAEQRLYRELDLANTFSFEPYILTPLNPNIALATTTIVVDAIGVITPAGTTSALLGAWNQLTPVSQDYLFATWPSTTGATVPQYFAMVTQSSVRFGPWPDAAYSINVYGTFRPEMLATATSTTLLTVYLPDLFFAACLVAGSGFQKNFSAMGDDPKTALSWEAHYQTLKQSAMVEEARKKFNAEAWSSKEPAPLATPPRN